MNAVIDEKTKIKLQKVLSNLIHPVKLVFFTKKNPCPTCIQQHTLLKELVSLSSKLNLKIYDFIKNVAETINYKIDKVPATAIIGKKDYGIRFYGLTAGYEFSSLIESIFMVSVGTSGFNSDLEHLIQQIKAEVNIQVIVTLTCPYCQKMVGIAHRFAYINENITASMIEASQFPHLIQRYNISGVPKTVINENHSFEGTLPEEAVYLEILKAVNPEEFNRVDKIMRKAQGTRKVIAIKANHTYEIIIIGGGPAAMSAAIYAVRKGLDVALIAKKLGGQIGYAAKIENYLGLSEIIGSSMVERFRNHVELFSIAEEVGKNVVEVKKEENKFVVILDDDRQFKSNSIIYCAGKEYRRLGIPGEERFIGKGIGFCATCDAPLYKGKKVAVVGGGNSAFTAIRDLINFASEINLIHRQTEFTANITLLNEVLKSKNVKIYTPMNIQSFLGKEKLNGIRLQSVDGKRKLDLNVDGVFLEIGLIPNTNPLKNLIELNILGELPVNRDQSTSLQGFFAAGDVTDLEEKQISIAVGQGAIAALSAHKYLVENNLTKIKIGLKESWQ